MTSAPRFEPPRFIAIEGPIRVGKTSLADILAERLNGVRLRDIEDNPFLESFYRDKPGAAFQAQFYFLFERFRQLRALDLASTSNRTVISDYLFEKDKIFAYMNLGDAELQLYNRYYELLAEQLPIPDLVIYLQAKPEALKRRIAKKNVPIEHHISEEYLEEVVRAYEHFFFHYKSSNLLVVETSEIDFVDRNDDLRELLRRLSQPVKGTQYFLPLGPVR
ncbi:MAG: deoxynucleoside kinase [Acidobacteria bacterium]|nr:deoxynucleoside kinase [Acidobacteriota bacterium]MBI1983848.1 deoxynucleoside kinase [Acidobacteriota bacterium]